MMNKLFCKLLMHANTEQIDAVLQAAVKRREELHPEWDMTYIALPKNDPEKRMEMLLEMVNLEQNHYGKDSCFRYRESAK